MTQTSTFGKVLRVFKAPKRLWGVVNKSPVRHSVRWAVDVLSYNARKARVDESRRVRLSEVESDALSSLRDLGFAEIPVSALDVGAVQGLIEYGREKVAQASELKAKQTVGTKSHWVRLSDADLAENKLSTSHLLVRFGIEEPLLRIVASYLGEAPLLRSVLLTHSTPMIGQPQSSQLWHQDRDDVRMLKVFMYLTDVENDDDGPFTFFDAKESLKVRNGFFMRHLNDEEFFSSVDSNQLKKLVRPKGSIFLVDTSRCYHMGSRVAEGHSRLMYTGLYTPAASIYPMTAQALDIQVDRDLSSLQRLAVQEGE